jgi:hypothetical protein
MRVGVNARLFDDFDFSSGSSKNDRRQEFVVTFPRRKPDAQTSVRCLLTMSMMIEQFARAP